MRKSDKILIRWLLEKSGLTIAEIASKTEIDQQTLIALKQHISDIDKMDVEIADNLIKYAIKVGVE